MVNERDEQSSARLRVIEKDPHGDDINGLMPPNELELLSESENLHHKIGSRKFSGNLDRIVVDVPIVSSGKTGAAQGSAFQTPYKGDNDSSIGLATASHCGQSASGVPNVEDIMMVSKQVSQNIQGSAL